MSSSSCLRCMARCGTLSRQLTAGRDVSASSLVPAFAAFSTSAVQHAVPVKKKSGGNPGSGPKKRRAVSFQMSSKQKKNKKGGGALASKGNPPKPGERKALRKRIVLSNTSALEVPGLEEMSADNVSDEARVGQMVTIPGPIVDRLRAAQAFRKTQTWHLFRRPSMLIRRETVELAAELEGAEARPMRRVVTGARGTGKSLYLLQAAAMAMQKGWIVVTIPEAHTIVDGSSDYRPIPNSKPLMYEQGQYSMEMLRRIVGANPQLKKLPLRLEHKLSSASSLPANNATLFDLCDLAVEDSDAAAGVLAAFLRELEAPGAPPALITLDGLGYVMRDSQYRSASLEPVHAHRLAVVEWVVGCLSGARTLGGGGAVLAATSVSNDPRVPSLDIRLRQLEVKQALERGLPNPDPLAQLPDATLPFLLATCQQPSPIPQPDPYYKHDEEVFNILGSPFGVVAGSETADASEVTVRALPGLSREEARGLMEYWARSGIMRREVTDRFVGERWILAGGGVVADLERGCIKMHA